MAEKVKHEIKSRTGVCVFVFNTMRSWFFVSAATLGSQAGFTQNRSNDSLSIMFHFTEVNVKDTNQLVLKISFRNNTGSALDMYQYLSEGYKFDRFRNLNIEMEKQKGRKYRPNSMRSYRSALMFRMEDSLRHFDLPKRKLPAYSSDTLTFNLFNYSGGFLQGKYRFKAHLRVKTIRDNTPYNDEKFETPPPEDQLIYVSSKWFYFVVEKSIAVAVINKMD